MRNVICKATVAILSFCAVARTQTVIPVCASGCAYSSVSAAMENAQEDTILELAAGEVFEPLRIITKRGVTVRSSRWRELPPAGYRIDPVQHADLLATIQALTFEPALSIGADENSMLQNGVDVAMNYIKFDYAPADSEAADGRAMVCQSRSGSGGALPAPLKHGHKYWIRDWDPVNRRARFAETPDGLPIDLTSVGSTRNPNYYSRPACVLWEQPRAIDMQGIRFTSAPGVFTRNLVQVGQNTETNPLEMGPYDISFHHVVATGIQAEEGPLFCMALFGGVRITVADSWIGHCKQSDGYESKGISIQNVVGAKITNNYVSAASINLAG